MSIMPQGKKEKEKDMGARGKHGVLGTKGDPHGAWTRSRMAARLEATDTGRAE